MTAGKMGLFDMYASEISSLQYLLFALCGLKMNTTALACAWHHSRLSCELLLPTMVDGSTRQFTVVHRAVAC